MQWRLWAVREDDSEPPGWLTLLFPPSRLTGAYRFAAPEAAGGFRGGWGVTFPRMLLASSPASPGKSWIFTIHPYRFRGAFNVCRKQQIYRWSQQEKWILDSEKSDIGSFEEVAVVSSHYLSSFWRHKGMIITTTRAGFAPVICANVSCLKASFPEGTGSPVTPAVTRGRETDLVLEEVSPQPQRKAVQCFIPHRHFTAGTRLAADGHSTPQRRARRRNLSRDCWRDKRLDVALIGPEGRRRDGATGLRLGRLPS